LIDILLSTYNGEKFLPEQLDSILNQTENNWRLLIRDDDSDDSTLEILQLYCNQHPKKIFLIDDIIKSNLGPCKSFNILMQKSTAPYVMFCDQDDIWDPEKIEVMLKHFKEMEEALLPETPLLLHSDMEVVDSSLVTISHSFIKLNKLDMQKTSINDLIMRNNITGCAMICNKLLIDLALPMPLDAIMHDWWLALVAAEFGKIKYIPQPLIKYRQHDNNYYGNGWKHKFKKYFKLGCYHKKVNKMSLQADSFYNSYKSQIADTHDTKFIAKFAKFHTLSFWKKRLFILKYANYYLKLSQAVGIFILG